MRGYGWVWLLGVVLLGGAVGRLHAEDICGLTGFVADPRLIIWRQTLEALSDYIPC